MVGEPRYRFDLVIDRLAADDAGDRLAVAAGLDDQRAEIDVGRVRADLRPGHEAPLRHAVGYAQRQVLGDVEPHVHQFQGGRGCGNRGLCLGARHPRAAQRSAHHDAQFGFDDGFVEVGAGERAPAGEAAVGQQIGAHRRVEAEHLARGVGREADLPARQPGARGQPPVEHGQLNAVRLLQAHRSLQAGRRIRAGSRGLPQAFNRGVDVHGRLLFMGVVSGGVPMASRSNMGMPNAVLPSSSRLSSESNG